VDLEGSLRRQHMNEDRYDTNSQPRGAPEISERAPARIHSFAPLSADDAETLILGTMPSEASLKHREYYGHPRNQFWRIISSILGMDWHMPYHDRCQALIRHRLALWDVVAHCERQGSLDSNILNEMPNALDDFLGSHTMIKRIVFNGGPAQKLFRRHFPGLMSGPFDFHVLYSTSPACARYSFDEKLRCWKAALQGPSIVFRSC
jgi:double-stranded uracil-DNA glycosylase